jgi:growth factor-regulated tyrosine kinase substrate
VDPNDLTAIDAENIVLFSTLVERIQETNNPIANDAQVQSLYNQIGSLRPKLIKGLEESARKHRKLLDMVHVIWMRPRHLHSGIIC